MSPFTTNSIRSRRILETPIAVIDLETTGLTAGADRVIEVSVVRVDPGKPPKLVLDTLVNPHRPVAATEIHGIRDEDVADAPSFRELAGDVLRAVEGCVIAAYNVYFDMKFLHFEMSNVGVEHAPPYFCLMYMRPLLKLGSRCKLDEACRQHQIEFEAAHVASNDALASARLLNCYMDIMSAQALDTYGDLMRLGTYKFLDSFDNAPYPGPTTFNLGPCGRFCSRATPFQVEAIDPTQRAIRQYWDTLKTVVTDLEITDEEQAHAVNERNRLGLAKEQIRVLHARAFASAIIQFCEDQWLDDRERLKLRKLHQCLSLLGWAPGE